MTVLDEYFELSDHAGSDKICFDILMSLFASKAKVSLSDGSLLEGKDAIETFFRSFFDRNKVLKHVWHTNRIDDRNLETKWAVAGMRKDNSFFSFTGTDKATVNSANKITYLAIRFDK